MEIGLLMTARSAKSLAQFLLAQAKLIEESEPEEQEDSTPKEERKQ